MDSRRRGGTRPGHLSEIHEEAGGPELSAFFLPPLAPPTGASGKPPEKMIDRQQVDPSAGNNQRRKLEENRNLLEELWSVEAELRRSLRLEEERQQEALFLRQQQNKTLWQNLCHLSLSQRVSKPWVTSYFQKFPMHIYCLPVQGGRHRGKRRGLKRKT